MSCQCSDLIGSADNDEYYFGSHALIFKLLFFELLWEGIKMHSAKWEMNQEKSQMNLSEDSFVTFYWLWMCRVGSMNNVTAEQSF